MHKINRKSLVKKMLLAFTLVVFLEPIVYSYKQNVVHEVFVAAKIICLFAVILYMVIRNRRPSKIILFITLYQLVRVLTNIILGIETMHIYGTIIPIIGVSLVFDIFFRENPRQTISVLNAVLFMMLLINIVSYYCTPASLTFADNIYFLGMRTRFTDSAYILAVLAMIEYGYASRRGRLLAYSTAAIGNILMANVTTGIVGLIVLYGLLIALKFSVVRKVVNYISILVAYCALEISIVVFRVQYIFESLVVSAFQKKITFTGRIYIWDDAMRKINPRNFIGNGFVDNGRFAEYRGIVWQAHNQILQVFYETGLLGIISFFAVLFVSGKNLSTNSKPGRIVLCGLFGLFTMMITEILSIHPFMYPLLVTAYNIKQLERNLGDTAS